MQTIQVTTTSDRVCWVVGDVTLFFNCRDRELVLEIDRSSNAPPNANPLIDHPRARGDGGTLHIPADAAAAAALRSLIVALAPAPLGLTTSAGFGDRLGLATPGHARAMQRSGAGIAPIFAQQSIREMERTNREPRQVLDDATFGAFQAGIDEQVGADADHLKTEHDIDRCASAGFSLYTVDPGDHVDVRADRYSAADLRQAVDAVPWAELASSWDDTRTRLGGHAVDTEAFRLTFDEEELARAAAKYGAAVAHATRMHRHLETKGIEFELEVSVDETDAPTSQLEHAYIALELRRLGVRWVSLAPRFVGRFEKGIDYLGDIDELRDDLTGHAAIAKALGPYKLSLHSGSDKFSVYPLIAEATRGLVHLKTAGTSYLEALRVVARVEPELFREMMTLARKRYEADRQTYHVQAELALVPVLATIDVEAFPDLLDDDHARQVLHVTYGSVLDHFHSDLIRVLREHETAHIETVARHFDRHLRPFSMHTARIP